MQSNTRIKYIVESNGDDLHLLYLLLRNKEGVTWKEDTLGVAFFASENNTNLVSLRDVSINGEWYCFYEPTSIVVNWADVESGMKERFPQAERVGITSIYHKVVGE